MNRFYFGNDLVVDLESVSCVGHSFAIIGGVSIKLPESAAYDLRRQFRIYKESADKGEVAFKAGLISRLHTLAVTAGLIGERMNQRMVAKSVKQVEVQ